MNFLHTLKSALLLSIWWIPRIFAIIFIIFLAVFSFDIFGQGLEQWKSIMLFITHNIPTLIITGALVLSWKRTWFGAISFIAMGVIFFFMHPGGSRSLFTLLPLFVIGLFFLLNWYLRADIKKAGTHGH